MNWVADGGKSGLVGNNADAGQNYSALAGEHESESLV
jgi:hypothetical protein